MIRSIISRDTSSKHHVVNVKHGSACSCTTINYCTIWLVVFMYNNKLVHTIVLSGQVHFVSLLCHGRVRSFVFYKQLRIMEVFLIVSRPIRSPQVRSWECPNVPNVRMFYLVVTIRILTVQLIKRVFIVLCFNIFK